MDFLGLSIDRQMHGAAADAEEVVRIRLGASQQTAPEILHHLALDPSLTVRAAVALNRATPHAANLALVRDADERVRTFLAQKLARLLPHLCATAQAAAQEHVLAVLDVLVEDEATRVRASITECVKSMPDVPHALILKLAHDQSVSVSDPVIRLSPLLTDHDLIALLTTLPHPCTARSVAERQGLSPIVSDAVVAHADHRAIRALLANVSATIRDATLDHLIDQAQRHQDWHGPLVSRPVLSPKAATALTSIVATHFLDRLLARADLTSEIATTIRARMAAAQQVRPAPALSGTDSELLVLSQRLHEAGSLDEACVIDSARRCDRRRMAAQLSVASGVSLAAIDRAVNRRSAKAIVSIVWQAGFSMRVAGLAQVLLGQSKPDTIIMPSTGGGYPFTDQEMIWQVELLAQSAV